MFTKIGKTKIALILGILILILLFFFVNYKNIDGNQQSIENSLLEELVKTEYSQSGSITDIYTGSKTNSSEENLNINNEQLLEEITNKENTQEKSISDLFTGSKIENNLIKKNKKDIFIAQNINTNKTYKKYENKISKITKISEISEESKLKIPGINFVVDNSNFNNTEGELRIPGINFIIDTIDNIDKESKLLIPGINI